MTVIECAQLCYSTPACQCFDWKKKTGDPALVADTDTGNCRTATGTWGSKDADDSNTPHRRAWRAEKYEDCSDFADCPDNWENTDASCPGRTYDDCNEAVCCSNIPLKGRRKL